MLFHAMLTAHTTERDECLQRAACTHRFSTYPWHFRVTWSLFQKGTTFHNTEWAPAHWEQDAFDRALCFLMLHIAAAKTMKCKMWWGITSVCLSRGSRARAHPSPRADCQEKDSRRWAGVTRPSCSPGAALIAHQPNTAKAHKL